MWVHRADLDAGKRHSRWLMAARLPQRLRWHRKGRVYNDNPKTQRKATINFWLDSDISPFLAAECLGVDLAAVYERALK